MVVDVSVSDAVRGEPSTSNLLTALRAGRDAVTSNKGGIALHGHRVARAAAAARCRLRFGTTVGGLVPILEVLVQHLPPGEVLRVRGVMNATSQFVLTQLAEGRTFPEALREGKRLGFTEPDPRRDLDGTDAAFKAAIVHNCLFVPPLHPKEIPREPVTPSLERRAQRARQRGHTLVALAEVRPGAGAIRIQEVPIESAWASPGATSIFEVETRGLGTLRLQGPGAGPEATAAGLYSELLELAGPRAHSKRRERG